MRSVCTNIFSFRNLVKVGSNPDNTGDECALKVRMALLAIFLQCTLGGTSW